MIYQCHGGGTKDKPFKTLGYFIQYIVPAIKSYSAVRVFALDDIVVDHQITFLSIADNLYFQKTDTGKFIFNQKVLVNDSIIGFYGCEFNNGLDVFQRSYCYVSGGLLKQGSNDIRVRYNASLTIDNVLGDIVFESTRLGNYFFLYNSAKLFLNGPFTLKGTFGVLIHAEADSFVRVPTNTTISTEGEVKGKAYEIQRSSALDLFGRGNNIFPESLTAGSADQYSTIC